MRLGWIAVVASACSFTPGELPSGGSDVLGNDADPTKGWSPPTELIELHDNLGDDDPSMTDDLLELYFGSRRTGTVGLEDIWVARRATIADPFGAPVNITELNSTFAETTMKVTGNGKAIYFSSDRGGNMDIYVSTRPDRASAWATPARVGELSTTFGDWAAFAQSDQLRIVLCSGQTEPQEALFTSTRANTGALWSTPAKITELDEIESECDPVEPRENVLYYSSSHNNTDGTFDIFRASRTSGTAQYGNRTVLPTMINLPGFNDRDPWVSADERTMVFSSDRVGGTQLYMSTRR